MTANCNNDDSEYGVLLYYKFTSVPDVNNLFAFYDSNCRSLCLLGRVRLSSNGVNVTIGGKLSALEKHIAEVSSNSLLKEIDFKLASCHQPANDKVAEECGFTTLSIRIVKELVTFSSHPLLKSPEVSNAGRHLSPAEFHSALQHAGRFLESNIQDDNKRVVLLDARNLYETRIGKFETPNVETLDPEIRQYSDLHSWIDDKSERLRGNHILMYCTGGIRCEMASAYIRSKGDGFENVFQLFGGIQRYLEQFPDGGFFKGKNFVFDHRVSVGSSNMKIMGNCLLCSRPFDDYTSRDRCFYCRMLVLVCNSCKKKGSQYVCELCKKNGKVVGLALSIEEDSQELPVPQEPEFLPSSDHSSLSSGLTLRLGNRPLRKLKILCLHGFRQNASSFSGRTASLAKKLKNIAEFVFINAPHELPFIYQPPSSNANDSAPSSVQQSPPKNCTKKFAWFIAPDSSEMNLSNWQIAERPFHPLQYQKQTDGFDRSFMYIQNVVQQEGPFDGVLGFSQGAAMAALVCAKCQMDFRFAVLCSGFSVNLANNEKGSINCPSLHIFSDAQANDRQIANQASQELSSLFDGSCSVIIEHEFGHMIPTRSPYIDEINEFLHRFL